MTPEEEIAAIPADELIVMSDIFYRAFSANNCIPCCHGCGNWITPRLLFKLATVNTLMKPDGTNEVSRKIETREVMLCDKCTAEDVEKRASTANSLYQKRREEGGGCFRINGKIVH